MVVASYYLPLNVNTFTHSTNVVEKVSYLLLSDPFFCTNLANDLVTQSVGYFADTEGVKRESGVNPGQSRCCELDRPRSFNKTTVSHHSGMGR